MTSRTQISVDPETLHRAKVRAGELGISLAEYLRRLMEADLREARSEADPRVVFDLGDSGGSDIARHKDEYAAAATVAGPADARPPSP